MVLSISLSVSPNHNLIVFYVFENVPTNRWNHTLCQISISGQDMFSVMKKILADILSNLCCSLHWHRFLFFTWYSEDMWCAFCIISYCIWLVVRWQSCSLAVGGHVSQLDVRPLFWTDDQRPHLSHDFSEVHSKNTYLKYSDQSLKNNEQKSSKEAWRLKSRADVAQRRLQSTRMGVESLWIYARFYEKKEGGCTEKHLQLSGLKKQNQFSLNQSSKYLASEKGSLRYSGCKRDRQRERDSAKHCIFRKHLQIHTTQANEKTSSDNTCSAITSMLCYIVTCSKWKLETFVCATTVWVVCGWLCCVCLQHVCCHFDEDVFLLCLCCSEAAELSL